MSLPTDTATALRELREGGTSVPMSMPPSFYTDAAMLPAEIDAVFLSGWLCVGRADEVPEPDDYLTLEMFDEPLLVVRGTDGTVTARAAGCRRSR